MPTTTNKVKFGLKNVHYAPITSIADDGTVTYGTVGEIKGAVNVLRFMGSQRVGHD